MIHYSGYLKEPVNVQGNYNSDVPLQINCSGYQQFLTRNFSVNRKNGRQDYQIIYIHKGKGTFYFDGSHQVLSEGSIVLYRPKEPQIFTYDALNQPQVYWIHFTGTDCERILTSFRLSTSYVGSSPSVKNLFEQIILELQLKKAHFEQMVVQLFYQLLICFHRNELSCVDHMDHNALLDDLIIELNQDYAKSWSIQTMSDFCCISTDYLSHLFKDYMGTSPMQFLSQIRINKAKDFLLDETITISEISYLVGYTDPLYFSRCFRKKEGISPKEYRCLVLKR